MLRLVFYFHEKCPQKSLFILALKGQVLERIDNAHKPQLQDTLLLWNKAILKY